MRTSALLLICINVFILQAAAKTKRFVLDIDYLNVTMMCQNKRIIAANGLYPGPTIRITQGDDVEVRVNNLVDNNVTIHWHGVKQQLSGWSDGPAYITQCPIQKKQSFTYRFKVDQVGTLFWHAHSGWMRETVHGAFIVEPRQKRGGYPFPAPHSENIIILSDWHLGDLDEEERNAAGGNGAPPADAYTINGAPGRLFNCSSSDNITTSRTHNINFAPGRTHLLRVINAALEQALFFSIAEHKMTVVEIDAGYTKPLEVNEFMITPGQTVAVLVKADHSSGRYFMAATPWRSGGAPLLLTSALGIVNYISNQTKLTSDPVLHALPDTNNRSLGESFQRSVRSLNSEEHPEEVPQTVDRRLFYVVNLNTKPCAFGAGNCLGPGGLGLTSSINNISFVSPSTSIMQAYYYNLTGVYTTDFPDNPLVPYDYTGIGLDVSQLATETGTKVSVIPYGANVQLVLQTADRANDSHPFHLHGFDFYVVGEGRGNFNASRDEPRFNLVDPPRRNTALLPNGWVALRFKADNPGVWLLHCHLEGHVAWGMDAVFIVENGKGVNQTLPPPPRDLPRC